MTESPANPTDATSGPTGGRSRLNLLLSYGGWRDESWAEQLPRLLDPMGIRSIHVASGEQAADVIRQTPVHIAVVDLRIPLSRATAHAAPAGRRILQILRHLNQPPPTVLVRPRQAVERESARDLAAALREGVFTVLDHPIRLETLLEVMRRIVRRHYADSWPAA